MLSNSILVQIVSAPERALGWLLYSFFLSMALSIRALDLLGAAILLIPSGVEGLVQDLVLLSRGLSGPAKGVMGFGGASEPANVVVVSTSQSSIPLDNCLTLCSLTQSWADEDFLSVSSSSSSSSVSSASLPSSLAKAFSTCGESSTGYDSGDESSEFEEYLDGDCLHEDSSEAWLTFGEIPRDLYFNGAAAARWNLDGSHSPLPFLADCETSGMEWNPESDASEGWSENELASWDLCFGGHEDVLGVV